MGKTNVKPLGENVLIEPSETKNKTAQGIYLPESNEKETPKEGKVLAIGDAKEIKIKKGQLVIFRQYSGTNIKVDGKKYILVKNEDILAVVE